MSRREKIEAMLADEPGDTFLRYSLAMELDKEGDNAASLAKFAELTRDQPPYVPAFFMAGAAARAARPHVRGPRFLTRRHRSGPHARRRPRRRRDERVPGVARPRRLSRPRARYANSLPNSGAADHRVSFQGTFLPRGEWQLFSPLGILYPARFGCLISISRWCSWLGLSTQATAES